MKKLLLVLAVTVLAVALLLQLPAVQRAIVAASVPDFPDWPAPVRQLGAGQSGEIFFATASPFDLQVILSGMTGAPATTGQGWLTYPAQASTGQPVPAMVILPGSGGIAPGREHEFASLLNEHGYAAFVVEYYAPRGLVEDSSYLLRTSTVTEFDLVTDAYAILQLLSTSPLIDAGRIAVMGFSYGGMAARLAMDDRLRQALAPDHPGFAAHVDVYGPCFQDLGTTATNGAPLLTQRGTEDASNDLPACQRREDALRALGVSVTSHVYEGAGHAWENSAPRALKEQAPYLSGCELTYDAAGLAYLQGEALFDYGPEADRIERILARFTSGPKFTDCLGYGYIVGRDEKTRAQARDDLLAFLAQQLGDVAVPSAP